MSFPLIEKLVASFDQLDSCIGTTLEAFKQSEDVPTDVINRVQQYSLVVLRQRSLVKDLETSLVNQDWHEVSRLVKIMNGLSAMIKDDALCILRKSDDTNEVSSSEGLVAS